MRSPDGLVVRINDLTSSLFQNRAVFETMTYILRGADETSDRVRANGEA